MNVRQIIAKTLGTFAVEFSEETVESLVKKVCDPKKEPKGGKHYNLLGFAYIVARNWAISEQRRVVAEAKARAQKILAAEAERLELELHERCKREFAEVVRKLLPNLRHAQSMQLRIVGLRCFEGLSDAECTVALSGTTFEQRYKWVTRGKALVCASIYTSDELKGYLGRRVAGSVCR